MKYFPLFAIILLCITGCNKHTTNQNPSLVHVFKGIAVVNTMGEIMGNWGTPDSDWETDVTWTSEEAALLNFPDTVSLAGTYIRDTTGWNTGTGIHEQPENAILVFPNPVAGYATLYFKGLGMVKFKATIVDKYFNRLMTFAAKSGMGEINLNLSDPAKFQNGVIYRLYYTLSATDSLNFYKGHGDILICREAVSNDCRQYVP